MYLSYLLIDTEAAPAHPRPGRTWVQNPYRVHQRLWMGFPSDGRKADDVLFLDPFVPTDFLLPKPVERAEDRVFLFRVDPVAGSNPSRHVVTVQSVLEPDWDYAFKNAPELLCGFKPPQPFTPTYAVGRQLRFRLRANATQRLRGQSVHPKGGQVKNWYSPADAGKEPKDRKGRRIGVYGEEKQRAWLDRHAARNGFRVTHTSRCDADGLARSWKCDDRITLASVRFEGTLEVTDAAEFRKAVIAGIGPGKGLGFGLLSLVPSGG